MPRATLEAAFGAGAIQTGRARADGRELPMIVPRDLGELREAVRFCARERLAIVPLGLGSKLGWCGPAERADVLLTTRSLSAMLSHEPGDGTLTAQAGMTMRELRERAAAGGHWVTPDVPRPARATLGGVLAASESGPDRLRYGPARHHVLGMRVVLADGSLAKSGGQLVKNVTGYDLHRLYCGSHGTLCVIVEASLRLFPLPERELVLAAGATSTSAMLELARRAQALPIRLHSLSAARSGSEWKLRARLAGRREPVEGERNALLAAWPEAQILEGAQARDEAERARDEAGAGEDLLLACRPPRLPAALATAEKSLAGLAATWSVEPAVATAAIRLESSLETSERASLARELRAALAPLNARLALRGAPQGIDPFGEPGPSVLLMRRIKGELDPRGVFARGRFHGGI